MRPINEIIVHCTATPEGRAVSVDTIRSWHKARGWSDIGYHYVVHLDGRVENGRPVEQVGSHVAGRNTGTIGVTYVGGVDASGAPKDTRTAAQKASLKSLLSNLLLHHPSVVKISGHNQYANKACPSFDAKREYASLLIGRAKQVTEIDPGNDRYVIKTRGVQTAATPGGEPMNILPKNSIVALTGNRSGDWMETKDGEWLPESALDQREVGAAVTPSRKTKGAALAGAGAAGQAVTEAAKTIEPMAAALPVLKWVFIALTVAGVALAIYAILNDATPGRVTEDA